MGLLRQPGGGDRGVDTCCQLVGVCGVGLYNSMADVQKMVQFVSVVPLNSFTD